MLPPPTNPVGTAGNILLIEEYSALATAFSALLRKAAPEHATRVVASLADAETAVRERTPNLLVVDVDPAPRGTMAFFTRLKAAAPDLRVLIIAANDVGELQQEPNGPATFAFIKKPFGVEQFSRVVRALLEPGGGAQTGTLRDLRVVDFLALQAVAGATTAIQVDAPDGRSGEIHFVDGRIAHALVVGKTGARALQEILGWRAPRVREIDRRSDAPRTIAGAWKVVLLEALRAARPEEPRAAPEIVAAMPERPTVLHGKKVLLIDDTELLLVFVEEVLSTAEPTLQIVTASSGLAGVEKAIAEKPDLILLDYSLPDITGGEVCRRLLADERTARLPIIMMSGHVPEMLAVSDEYENVVAAIPKPFLSTALLELLDRTLTDLPKAKSSRRKRGKPRAPAASQDAPRSDGTNGHAPAETSNQTETAAPPAAPEAAAAPAEPAPEPEPTPPEPLQAEAAAPPIIPPPVTAAPEPTPPNASAPTQVPLADQPSPSAASAPASTSPAAPAGVKESPEPAVKIPPSPTAPGGLTPAVIQAAARNVVVLSLPLEVVAMQFSPSLQMRAIRARPISPTIALHVLPPAVSGAVVPEARFEIARVNLDERGRVDTIRVAPTTRAIPALVAQNSVSIVGLAVLLANGGSAVELMPAPAAPLGMQLTALFELAGVELSPAFRVAHLVLRWRGGNMHVSQQTGPGPTSAGVNFETAQILLDRAGRIAEILLDAPA